MKSPIFLAIIAGFAFSVFQLSLPAPANRAIEMLAMTSTAIALFYIGGALVGLEFKNMMGDVLQIVGGKLVIHPLLVFLALALLPPIEPEFRLAAITLACVPMMSIYPILGQRYRQEGICAAALMVATLLSFITITMVLWMAQASETISGT